MLCGCGIVMRNLGTLSCSAHSCHSDQTLGVVSSFSRSSKEVEEDELDVSATEDVILPLLLSDEVDDG